MARKDSVEKIVETGHVIRLENTDDFGCGNADCCEYAGFLIDTDVYFTSIETKRDVRSFIPLCGKCFKVFGGRI